MKKENTGDERISPDSLLALSGFSPADNREGYNTVVHWKSKLGGQQVRLLFLWKDLIDSISQETFFAGPVAFAAGWQKILLEFFIIEPIKFQAEIAARTGKNPDIFIEKDEGIESTYARMLYDLCGFFITDGRFDREKALHVSSSPEGKNFLKKYVYEFTWLEYMYNSIGLSRLTALKELLKCLLMAVTEKPLEKEDLPYIKKTEDGSPVVPFPKYLDEIRIRLENLYRADAFDIKAFSERATHGKLGYSDFEIVEGSELHSVSLRYYPLPKGIKPCGKVLYLASPLINKPEIFDMAKGKSLINKMLEQGYIIYLVDHGNPGPEEADLCLDFYGKIVHDKYLEIIKEQHPRKEVYVMGYCMGGTLILPYLARRAEERMAQGKKMDIKKVALMTTPVKFDDWESGHGPMRKIIKDEYDPTLMHELFGDVNIPPQTIQSGVNDIQPGVQYNMASGFFARSLFPGAIDDSAHFLFWLTHGTKFSACAHEEWIKNIFLDNQIYKQSFCLSSANSDLDGKPVNMDILKEAGVSIFDYRGERDPISPVGSCIASEIWGQAMDGNIATTRGGMNRTIEKNVGHIFVVSKKLLAEYIDIVSVFYRSGKQ